MNQRANLEGSSGFLRAHDLLERFIKRLEFIQIGRQGASFSIAFYGLSHNLPSIPSMSNPRPFNIRILVAEGMPDGLRLVEKSNWVGLGIICPRGRYPEVKKRAEFSGSGVYILVGSEGEGEYPMLY